MVKSILLTGSL